MSCLTGRTAYPSKDAAWRTVEWLITERGAGLYEYSPRRCSLGDHWHVQRARR